MDRVVLATSVVFALASAGCAHPECWTGGSKADECWSGGYSTPSSPRYDPDSTERNYRRQLREYGKECTAGDAIACWMVGDAQAALHRPAPEIEASFAAACTRGLGVIPGSDQTVCGRAGAAAEGEGGSGRAAAQRYYQLGCERGAASDCQALMRLMPLAPIEVAITACRGGAAAGCMRGLALAEPRRHDWIPWLTYRGCASGDAQACGMLGRLEAAAPTEGP